MYTSDVVRKQRCCTQTATLYTRSEIVRKRRRCMYASSDVVRKKRRCTQAATLYTGSHCGTQARAKSIFVNFFLRRTRCNSRSTCRFTDKFDTQITTCQFSTRPHLKLIVLRKEEEPFQLYARNSRKPLTRPLKMIRKINNNKIDTCKRNDF